MRQLLLWFKIIRPQTLFASFCPVCLALVVSGVEHPMIAVLTLLCAVSLQIFANLCNDYYDYFRGADKKGREGFKRVLAEGVMSVKHIKVAAFIAGAIAVLVGLPLVWTGKGLILSIGLFSLFFAWLYSATRYSLAYLGIADIFVFLFFGIIPGIGTEFLQHGFFTLPVLLTTSVCGILSMCVLMVNNLRDIDDDASSGKMTFPVRFGKKNGERLMLFYILSIPCFLYLYNGVNLIMIIPVLALWLHYELSYAKGKQYNICLFLWGLLNLLYLVLVTVYKYLM